MVDQQRLIDLLGTLQIALFLKDPLGRYLSINPAGAAMLNQPLHHVVGHDDFKLFDPASADLMRWRDSRIAQRAEPLAYRCHAKLLNERETTQFVTIKFPVVMAKGLGRGVLGLSFFPPPHSQHLEDIELLTRELVNRKADLLIDICRRQGELYGKSV